jgi:hypothetical protein
MNKFIDRTLKKFNATDISFVIEQWEFLAENFDVSAIPTKKADFLSCISRLLRTSKVKVTKANIGQLELLLVHKNAAGRVWKMFRATQIGDSNEIPNASFIAEFQNSLSASMDILMAYLVVNDVAWLWLDVAPNASRPKLAYAVHPLGTEFLFLSGTLGSKEGPVLRSFQEVLHASAVVPLKLSGRCIQSMYEMAVQTYPQSGAHPSKIANVKQQCSVVELDAAPQAEGSQPQKRRRENREVALQSTALSSTHEHRPPSASSMSSQRNGHRQTAELFDTDQIPVLENIEYNMKTNCRGIHKGHEAYAELSKGSCHCQVTFSGQHVVKGLKQLAVRNLASTQVNNLVQQVIQSAQSNFTIENS